jgi:CRISPR-associated endonuclease/helicase Cas3
MGTFFAHTLPGSPQSEWEPLQAHLLAVAALAGEFADAFGSRGWGQLLGLWHDLGKFSVAFQDYLSTSTWKTKRAPQLIRS